jgi:hypothetical protein
VLAPDVEETLVLNFDDVDREEVGAEDLEVPGRDKAGAKHLVDLLKKLNKF